MQKRYIIQNVLDGKQPDYVPWSMGFTKEARQKLQDHFTPTDLEETLDNHILKLGSDIGFFVNIGGDYVQDVFGVVWDRSVDKDIGIVRGQVLKNPTLKGYTFPDPLDVRFYEDIPQKLQKYDVKVITIQ